MSTYLRILSYTKPYLLAFIGSIILTLLFAATNVLIMPLMKDISREISNKNLDFIGNHVLNGGLLWLGRVIFQYSQFYLTSWISKRITVDIQVHIYQKFMSLSQHYYSKTKLGDILTRLFSDSDHMRRAITMTFNQFLPQMVSFFAVLGYLFYQNWRLTGFTLLAVPLFVFFSMYFSAIIRKVSYQIQKKQGDLTHISQETLTNVKVVQAYTMEGQAIQMFNKESMHNFNIFMKSVKFKSIMRASELFLQGLVALAILYVGGRMVAAGIIDGSQLVEFFVGIALLIDPVQALSSAYAGIQEAMASVDRIFEVFDTSRVINSPKNGETKPMSGDVEFDNVCFSYDKEENVIKNLNLKVPPGQIVALVGLSGAGKTTLVNFLPRFYDVTEGNLLIDGVNIKDWDLHALRAQIALVPQEDILFRGTILENIRYGRPSASVEDVVKAAEQANAMEFINDFPDKLYSKIGDRGHKLSGGQKQRISLARAILKDPKLLILDEATSALDSQSENLVQDALEKIMKNRTTFVIAHRLSTIINAHKIVVMDNGEILETGTHDDLLNKNGQYAKFYRLQFEKNLERA